MNNPFYEMPGIISDQELFIGGKANFEKLQSCIDKRIQTAILGPMGCGKSSLLNTFFNRDYRINAAKNKNILISPVSEFDSKFSEIDIYNYLYDIVRNSVRILKFCDKVDQMNELLSAFDDFNKQSITDDESNKYEKAKTKFLNALNEVHEYGYRMVFVIDNFEEFTSSKTVTMDHHSVMRKCLEKSQYIVATNFDLNKDSLPRDVKGSLYLQAFGNGLIRYSNFDKNETAEFIAGKLEECDITFSDELISTLYDISGGNPTILARAAGIAFDQIIKNGSEENLSFKNHLVNDSVISHLFKNWCLMFTDSQIKCISEIDKNCGLPKSTETKSAAEQLKLRGFLRDMVITNDRGQETTIDGRFEMNGLLYDVLFENVERIKETANSNPLRAEDNKIKTPFDQLKELVNSDNFDMEQFIASMNEILSEMPGVTKLVDMKEPITDEELGKYFITRALFNSFDRKVQAYIEQGIKTCAVFRGTHMADFSPCIVLFCKAIEYHLNKTVVAVMKKALHGYTVEYGNRHIPMNSINNTLMLGELHYILRQFNDSFGKRNYDIISDILSRNRISAVPSWKKYTDTLFTVKDLRNDCPHPDPLTEEKSRQMLRTLFQGADSFIALNSRLYQDAKSKNYVQ